MTPVTVEQLIQLLQQYPGDYLVVVDTDTDSGIGAICILKPDGQSVELALPQDD